MRNEHARAEMESVLEEVQQQFKLIAQIQQDRAQLTASATVRKRVTVTVNADGTLIETKFGPDIADLNYGEIARAVTEAAQQAAAEVARKAGALMTPLQEKRARLPKITDLIEGMADIVPPVPEAPPVSLEPPDRHALQRADEDSAPMEFNNVEAVDPTGARGRGVTDSSW